MKAINLSIRKNLNDEAESFNILLPELPNDYGLYNCKIVDDTLSEIFSVTKSSLSDCVIDLVSIIHSLGQVINIHEIKPDEETKQIIDRIRNLHKG